MSTTLTERPMPFAGTRPVPWRAFAITFVLTALALVLFAGTFAMALTSFNANKVVPGTVVADVPLGGLTRAAAEVRLREQLPSLSSGHLSITFGPVQEQITFAEVGRDYDIAAMLDQAFAIGRDGDFLDQAQQQLRIAMNGATVQPQVKWDEQALERRLNELATAAETQAIDATITRQAGQFVVNPSREGTTVDVQVAWQQALAAVASLSPADVQITVNPVIQPPAVTTAQAQLAVDRAQRVAGTDLELTYQAVTTRIPASTILGWTRLDAAGVGVWNLVVEQQPVAQFVAQQSASVYKAPVDASFKWVNDSATPVPGSQGLELDVEATTQAVYAALTGRADGAMTSTVPMSVVALDPTFTTAMAVDLAPKVREVSSWTTGFIMSERNFFGANIVVPAQLINGTVVPAGAKFDFWATVGSLADIPGIGPGGFIDHGRTNPTGALGGGICSCSTTLWNAALRAGLDMKLRANHAYYIDRYPTGLDATVFRSGSSVQNMTFFNDTPYPIIIRGLKGETKTECSGLKEEFGTVKYSNCVIFEIWAVPFHRTVTFTDPVITDLKVAKDYIEYATMKPDKTPLLPGERLRLEYPTNGFRSSVTRTVRDENGAIIHQDTYASKYIRVNGLTLIGWQEGDPPVGEQFPNPDPLDPIQPPEAEGLTPV